MLSEEVRIGIALVIIVFSFLLMRRINRQASRDWHDYFERWKNELPRGYLVKEIYFDSPFNDPNALVEVCLIHDNGVIEVNFQRKR